MNYEYIITRIKSIDVEIEKLQSEKVYLEDELADMREAHFQSEYQAWKDAGRPSLHEGE